MREVRVQGPRKRRLRGSLEELELVARIQGERGYGGGPALRDPAAHDLGVAILTGRYAPGETLPGEIEFSEQLNVSRTASRIR